MADLADIENALAALLADVLYPNGGTQPSVTGDGIRIQRGWPQPTALNKALTAGQAMVTVFSLPGGSRNVTRYARSWHSNPLPPCSLIASASGNVAAFGGVPSVGQLAGISAANFGASYAVQSGDTLISIAAALAAEISRFPGMAASASGAMVTVLRNGQPVPVSSVSSSVGTEWRETRRQDQMLMVSAWCPTPDMRDAISNAIDTAMSAQDWLDAGDPVTSRITYVSTAEIDSAENASLYRRDFRFLVEYATIQTVSASPMLYPSGTLTDARVVVPIGFITPT